MPKKTAVFRVPYEKAIELLGSEEPIRDQARRVSTLSTWRKKGVPADVLLPKVLQQQYEPAPPATESLRVQLDRLLSRLQAEGDPLSRPARARYRERVEWTGRFMARLIVDTLMYRRQLEDPTIDPEAIRREWRVTEQRKEEVI